MLELREGVVRIQLVEVVDDQHDRCTRRTELGQDRVDDPVVIGRGRRRRSHLRIARRCRAANRI
jgi:hypothetical protein